MRCPSCGHPESKVVDSRSADDGYSIRRRRECLSCESRFTTYERTSENPLVIIKSDGSSEAYDREKLFRGLLIACAKRPVSAEKILEKLSNLDEVAYIRFASVYKDFKTVDEFRDALKGLY